MQYESLWTPDENAEQSLGSTDKKTLFLIFAEWVGGTT
jgi:hypothetical protein